MIAQNIFFGIIAALMLFSAFRVVTTKNVVHAALYLVVVFAGVAAQFILLLAEFVAIAQILVYIGAIVVLLLFGIMLTDASFGKSDDLDNKKARVPAIITAAMLAIVMGYALLDGFDDVEIEDNAVQTAQSVSDSIFGTYLIPFEAISVLLLAALIGAVVLARKD